MYSLTLQNAPEFLRPGFLTKQYSDQSDDEDQDTEFKNVMKNAEKQIQNINQHLAKAKNIDTDIDKYKNTLQQIQANADAFLGKNEEILTLLDQMIEDAPK